MQYSTWGSCKVGLGAMGTGEWVHVDKEVRTQDRGPLAIMVPGLPDSCSHSMRTSSFLHSHTHTPMHTCTHACTHACTHTHAHTHSLTHSHTHPKRLDSHRYVSLLDNSLVDLSILSSSKLLAHVNI